MALALKTLTTKKGDLFMNSSIQVFNYNTHEIRTVDKDGEVWFVAKDVADILEFRDAFNAIRNLDDDEKGTHKVSTLGGEQEMTIISEPALYDLVLRSNKPEAKKFSRWVRHELLPQVLRTGNYSIKNEQIILPYGALEGAKFILEDAGITGNQRTLALDKMYKSYTGKSVLLTTGIELEAPVKEQPLTPTEIAEILGIGKGRIGARLVNNLLANAGYQRKVSGKWEPTELGKPYAYMVDASKSNTIGTPIVQLKWYSSILEVVKKLVQEMANAMNLAQAV